MQKNYIKNLGVSLAHEFVFITKDFTDTKIARVYDSKRVIVNAFIDYINNEDDDNMKEIIKGYGYLRILTADSTPITLYGDMFIVKANRDTDNVVIHITESVKL
jgi:hypothetical protein|nr:MAG TPA: hypothetical protein [Caudoviricetes sp.]